MQDSEEVVQLGSDGTSMENKLLQRMEGSGDNKGFVFELKWRFQLRDNGHKQADAFKRIRLQRSRWPM